MIHMELKQISFKNKVDINRIKRLYTEAFPKDEQAPFRLLVNRAKKGKAEMLDLIHHNVWCGMAYTVTYADMVYLFYFAVDAVQRGKGLGSQAIKAILDRYKGKRVFLALEDWNEPSDNTEQRIKRHHFYQNCGLSDLPYKLKEAKMKYAIMGVNGKIEPDEYKALIDNYLGFPLKYLIEMRIIKEQ